jgi:5,10-methylenetetrahydromethanopterin reductase
VEVAATGPKTIAMAAVAADRVMLTLGGRLAGDVDGGRDAPGIYVNVCCHPDLPTARDVVRGSTAIFAHFSAMSAAAGSDLSGHEARVVAAVGRGYDGDRHGLSSAAHIGVPDDEFIDGFAVVGSAEQCRRRLAGLVGLGLDRVIHGGARVSTDQTAAGGFDSATFAPADIAADTAHNGVLVHWVFPQTLTDGTLQASFPAREWPTPLHSVGALNSEIDYTGAAVVRPNADVTSSDFTACAWPGGAPHARDLRGRTTGSTSRPARTVRAARSPTTDRHAPTRSRRGGPASAAGTTVVTRPLARSKT